MSDPIKLAPHQAIEPATLPEMNQVADLVRSSADWYEPFVDEADMGEHNVDASWAKENHELRDFFVLKEHDDVIGTVSMQDAGDCLYLGYVYLHADHTGRGLGRSLLDFAVAEAQRQGKQGLVLIAHPEATWAMRAYARYGFEVIATSHDDVLAWNDGFMKPYHEHGFVLHKYTVDLAAAAAA